jgi:DDE superfamily endonuclease/Helix-turn-helix of DDE superfamily endonuclease
MISVTKLRRKPRHFQAFTGVSVAEFDQLLAQVAPAYEADQQRRRNRGNQLRPKGSGHPFTLDLPQRLLMGLMYLRLYVCQNLLAYLFDLDQSNISRELNDRLLPILLEVLPVPLRDAPLRHLAADKADDPNAKQSAPAPKRRRINTLKELLEAYPDIEEVLLDATEQGVPQPQDKVERKLRYSGKQHDHTIKTQIVATRDRILHVFGGLPGSVNDQMLLGASGVMLALPAHVKIRLDKGYEGTHKRHPNRWVEQPVKGQRNHKVTVLGRAYNYMLSRQRIYVEHHFARLQKFGILRDVYRGGFDGHENVFCIVSGLLNFRATGQFSLA